MKKSIGLLALLVSLAASSTANADPVRVGADFSLGFPDALGVGAVVEPGVRWLRLGVSFQDNYVAPGLKGSIIVSPIKFVVFPEVQADYGGFFREQLPFSVDGYSFNIAYTYEDVLLNIGFGNRDKAFFFLSGGVSHLNASIDGLPQIAHISNQFFSNPNFSGWLPVGRLGFVVYFNQ